MFFNEGKFYEYMCTTSIEFVVVIFGLLLYLPFADVLKTHLKRHSSEYL